MEPTSYIARYDRIHVRDLRVEAIIGVDDRERTERQELLIQITLLTDLRAAGRSDRLADSIDYRAFTQAVVSYVRDSRHYLVEALATGIAEIGLVAFGALAVRVRVDKTEALPAVGAVGVEIERHRTDLLGGTDLKGSRPTAREDQSI